MYDLQTALDKKLASLKDSKSQSKQSLKKHIEHSLKQAGILNRNGKMVNKVAS